MVASKSEPGRPTDHRGEPRWDQAAPGDLGTDTAERDAMLRRIRRLPHRQRAVLVLRYYEDLDDATIAQILTWPARPIG